MSDALKNYLGAGRGRATKLANDLGLSRSYVSDLANGKKRGSVETMRRVAEITGIDAANLLGAAMPDELHDQATPYTPAPVARDTTIDAVIAPNVRQRQTFIVETPAPALHILTGDVIIIDMRNLGQSGDIVLAAILDGDFRETRILRYLPPHLVSGDPAEPPIPESAARIQGKIVGLVRGLST